MNKKLKITFISCLVICIGFFGYAYYFFEYEWRRCSIDTITVVESLAAVASINLQNCGATSDWGTIVKYYNKQFGDEIEVLNIQGGYTHKLRLKWDNDGNLQIQLPANINEEKINTYVSKHYGTSFKLNYY
jgi:hypothetical protein